MLFKKRKNEVNVACSNVVKECGNVVTAMVSPPANTGDTLAAFGLEESLGETTATMFLNEISGQRRNLRRTPSSLYPERVAPTLADELRLALVARAASMKGHIK